MLLRTGSKTADISRFRFPEIQFYILYTVIVKQQHKLLTVQNQSVKHFKIKIV